MLLARRDDKQGLDLHTGGLGQVLLVIVTTKEPRSMGSNGVLNPCTELKTKGIL